MKSIRWVAMGEVFELASPDDELLETAARVFVIGREPLDAAPARTWTVDRGPASGLEPEWSIAGESLDESMIPATARSRDIAIARVEQDALDYLLRKRTDHVVVHAALIAKSGAGILIVGPSLAGKSTLATALWRSGWSLLSDDMAFIVPERKTAAPAPRRVSLRFESRTLIGDDLWQEIRRTPSCVELWKGLFFHPHEVAGTAKLMSANLAGIVFLARRDSTAGPAEAMQINPAKAALSLIPYAMNARDLPLMEAVRVLAPLLAEVPAFDLGRGDLRAMVEAVESLAPKSAIASRDNYL